MKNFYFKAILLCFCLFASINAFAMNYLQINIDGIYYNLYGEHNEAAVTYKQYRDGYYYSDYSGIIVIPESVTYDGKTYNVTSIDLCAFIGCSVTSVTIPNSVTIIGGAAFENCRGLTSITIPNSVTCIENGAFYNCSGLTSITIPESITNISGYAFDGCSSLNSFTIPQSVTSIGGCAFQNCTSLTSITIPNNVTSIGDKAFYGCYRLTSIYSLNSVPPTCLSMTTFECSTSYVRDKYDVYNYATLHVPMGSKEAYSSAYEWRYFNKIKEDMEMGGQMFYTTLSVNHAGDGFVQHYVKADEPYTLFIGSEEGMRINTVLFNGEDVTDRLVDGYYTTPNIVRPSKIVVSFEQDPDGIESISADDNLHVYGNDGSLFISGIEEPQVMFVYTLDGKLANSQTLEGDTKIKLNEGVYIVKVGDRTFKVSM